MEHLESLLLEMFQERFSIICSCHKKHYKAHCILARILMVCFRRTLFAVAKSVTDGEKVTKFQPYVEESVVKLKLRK